MEALLVLVVVIVMVFFVLEKMPAGELTMEEMHEIGYRL